MAELTFRLAVGGQSAPPWQGAPEYVSVYRDLELTIVLNYLRIVLMLLSIITAETHEHGHGFLAEYWEILSNPAHMAVEITLMFAIDVILLGLLWPLVRRFIDAKLHKQHEEFDKEHGIHHHDDHIHFDPDIVHPSTEHPGHD